MGWVVTQKGFKKTGIRTGSKRFSTNPKGHIGKIYWGCRNPGKY